MRLSSTHAEHLDETRRAAGASSRGSRERLAAAARWHRRAAEWVGLNDIKAALQHWQRVRELARQGGDEPEATALTIVACSQALAHGWRLGASATEWAELFAEGCAAAERAGDLAALAVLNAAYRADARPQPGDRPLTTCGTPARRYGSPIARATRRCAAGRVPICLFAHAVQWTAAGSGARV